MPENFGAQLRRRREERDIPLSKVAAQTKISRSLLDALERDDVSHWPTGVFRRSFVRSYAEAVGLNPDVVVREFFEAHPEPVEVVEPSVSSGSAPTRFREMVDSAIGSLSSRLRRRAAPAEPVIATEAPPAPPSRPLSGNPDFQAVAQLCTRLARIQSTRDVQALLGDAARILDAEGVIVWTWNPSVAELRPAISFGYSTKVLAQLPAVKRDAANATAAAFRSGQPCAISANGRARGALVIPLVTASGCAGVLAIELPHEQSAPLHAVATIVAAQLAQCLAAHPFEAERLNDNEATSSWPLMSPSFVSAKVAPST